MSHYLHAFPQLHKLKIQVRSPLRFAKFCQAVGRCVTPTYHILYACPGPTYDLGPRLCGGMDGEGRSLLQKNQASWSTTETYLPPPSRSRSRSRSHYTRQYRAESSPVLLPRVCTAYAIPIYPHPTCLPACGGDHCSPHTRAVCSMSETETEPDPTRRVKVSTVIAIRVCSYLAWHSFHEIKCDLSGRCLFVSTRVSKSWRSAFIMPMNISTLRTLWSELEMKKDT